MVVEILYPINNIIKGNTLLFKNVESNNYNRE